jgi:hypothetical protein
LHNHRHFQRGTAAGAFLTGGHAGELSFQVDFGGHCVSANGAEDLSLGVFGDECSHFSLSSSIRRKLVCAGFKKFHKVFPGS